MLQGRRILVVAEYGPHGGTREYFTQLLRLYAKEGAVVKALVSYEDSDQEMLDFAKGLGFSLSYLIGSMTPGLRTNILTRTRFDLWTKREFLDEVRIFERLCDEFNIEQVVISSGTSGRFLGAAWARPNPVVIAHGYPHGVRQRLLGRRVMRKRLPGDTTLITVSEYGKRQFTNLWQLRDSTNVKRIYSTCGEMFDSKKGLERDISVLTAAVLDPYKEPRKWIDVVRKIQRDAEELDPMHFVWIGDGPLLSDARRAIEADVDARIEFPGWVDSPTDFYQRAQTYLQMSTKEALGLSVVDALRHGVPCVVTETGGLPEVVLNGSNGFVVAPGDVDGAKSALIEILKNPKLHSEFSRNARRIYVEKFAQARWEQEMVKAHLTVA